MTLHELAKRLAHSSPYEQHDDWVELCHHCSAWKDDEHAADCVWKLADDLAGKPDREAGYRALLQRVFDDGYNITAADLMADIQKALKD